MLLVVGIQCTVAKYSNNHMSQFMRSVFMLSCTQRNLLCHIMATNGLPDVRGVSLFGPDRPELLFLQEDCGEDNLRLQDIDRGCCKTIIGRCWCISPSGEGLVFRPSVVSRFAACTGLYSDKLVEKQSDGHVGYSFGGVLAVSQR